MARYIPQLVVIGKRQVWHFKNAAARAKAGKIETIGQDAAPFFRLVDINIATTVYREKEARAPQLPIPSARLGQRSGDRDAFAALATQLAQLKPNGFRQPSAKAKNWQSTSLVEVAARAAGSMDAPKFERSRRGECKLEADAAMKAAIAAERRNGINPKYLSAHARRRLSAERALAA